MRHIKIKRPRNSPVAAPIEHLEPRLLFASHGVPRLQADHRMAVAPVVQKTLLAGATRATSSVWALPVFPTLPPLTANASNLSTWHAPLALTSNSTSIPSTPAIAQTVQLTIGGLSGNIDQPLGVNIGSSTSYGQGNTVNNLLAQGGSFELANGRIIVQGTTGSTSNTVVVTASWLWQSMGYTAAIGQTLVGSTGANMHGSWTITNMQDQLDSSGNATGNTVITIAGHFSSVPVAYDSFFVQIMGNGSSPLADGVQTTGNATVTRDNTTAYSGNSSALFTFGSGANNSAALKYYFGADSTAGRNVLQPGHTYQLSFWAKTSTAAMAQLGLYQGPSGNGTTVALIADGQWHEYSVNVNAVGPVQYQNGIATVSISGSNARVNLDVVKLVDLSDQISPNNPLSAEVVSLIQQYGFSNIRFWDPNLRYASLDDIIGPADARPMIIGPGTIYSPMLGLPEMLQLCAETHTSMWLVLPTTWTPQDMHNLMEYLGGSTSTVYGAKRAADGHPASWFDDISMIHLEAGNESWNGTFFPNSYSDFDAYFSRAEEMFHAVKTDPLYAANAGKISLIANGWQWNTWFDQQAIQKVPDADAIDASAYTSGPNTEMDLNDLLAGALSDQLSDDSWEYPTSTLGKPVMVYEEAPGEINGGLTATTESAYATSLAAGLATIRNAMVLERDYGISTQNLFTLLQYGDNTPEGFVQGHYGIFADEMTASTNPRPVALAAQLLDQAKGQILSSSLTSGWVVDSSSTQALATTTQAADAMVTYDGNDLVITMFNNTVQDNESTTFNFNIPTSIAGHAITANWAAASYSILSGASVSSNNETTKNVAITNGTFLQNGTNVNVTLAAHSMSSLVIPLM